MTATEEPEPAPAPAVPFSSFQIGEPLTPQTLARNQEKKPPPGIESTDFDLYESKQYADHATAISKTGRKLHAALRWALLVSIGTCTGVVAIFIDLGVEKLVGLRGDIDMALRGRSIGVQYLGFVGCCLFFVAIPGFMVCFVEPLAAGSGIPEVKCFLNGVHLPRVVDLKTLLVKAPGVLFSVAAGMPCGKEGPMIHSGACVGGVIGRKGAGPLMRSFRTDIETRDLVAAGASSGVAAAFGAPLGGVLFAMEEGASFFTPVVMLRSFVCCTSAALFVRFMLAGIKGEWGQMGQAAPLSFDYFANSAYRIWEMPVFALMGAVGGLCGAGFNTVNTHLTKWRMRNIGGTGIKRYLEVFVVTFIVTSIMFWMPVCFSGDNDPAKFSMAAKLFREPGTVSIKNLFHVHQNVTSATAESSDPHASLDLWELFAFFILYYGLACLTYGLGVPSGLFVPSLLTGAAFGRLVGELVKEPFGCRWDDSGTTDPGVYALMGATAMLSGMARITVSLAVILMEASGSVQWALPIFVTCVCSKWAGDFFTIGLYDIHIELKHIPLLEATPEREAITVSARDVMTQDLVTLSPLETVRNMLRVLEGCSHGAFPIVLSSGVFVGLLKRDTLVQVLRRGKAYGALCDRDQVAAGCAQIIPFKNEREVWNIETIKAAFGEEDYAKVVDLRPYVNQGCYTVPEHACLSRVHMLFRGMGLRHLPVVKEGGIACGVITRKDLIVTEHVHLGPRSPLPAGPLSFIGSEALLRDRLPSV